MTPVRATEPRVLNIAAITGSVWDHFLVMSMKPVNYDGDLDKVKELDLSSDFGLIVHNYCIVKL